LLLVSVADDDSKGRRRVMAALDNSGALWMLIFLALAIVFLLPTLVGLIRRVDRLALVFVVNVIGGLTGIGWLAAMILAFGPRRPTASPVSWSSRTY
jgi:hypothetical protein